MLAVDESHVTTLFIKSGPTLLAMKQAVVLLALFVSSLLVPFCAPVQAQSEEGMSVLHSAVNPSNNNTYYLLSASSWEDAASYARSLDGFLVTVDDASENQWLYDTFATWDNQSRHLWIGLSDSQSEGQYRWHDGTPFLYRHWGQSQPSAGGDEDYVHIAGTNMGNIEPGTWNDLENDPQYFPVYGVVERGPGANYALRFDGEGDHVVVEHDNEQNITQTIDMEAWIHPTSTEGVQFIMMKGDYGWGLALQGDTLAFASEYSLSKHPRSNRTVVADEWTHVRATIEAGVGGQMWINGIPSGDITADAANIPLGDFGSNDCYSSGESCDEFYIGRMGAGCDCHHFQGMIDNVTVRSVDETGNPLVVMEWLFTEGEGGITRDSSERLGTIVGADWVMPDGSIVAQAVELFAGQEYTIEQANQGDTLLFFTHVEDYTRTLVWFSSSWMMDDFNSESSYEVYVGFGYVADKWNNNDSFSSEFGFAYESWSWPEEGTMWFTMSVQSDMEQVFVGLESDTVDPPPSLDEMVELNDGIPVPNQNLERNPNSNEEVMINYYYVNVTEPLADLRVRTYGGRGNVELAMSGSAPISPTNWWEIGIPLPGEDGDVTEPVSKEAWSTNPGNDEEVHLYDVQPGVYYITAYTYRMAERFTIAADFVYPPENVEPDDAVELTPGIAYGPISGYEGLSQFFKVEVAEGTERLVLTLSGGQGEASMFMRHEMAPTRSTYDLHSTTEGANDRIAFNDPTPGWWYILISTERAFSGVSVLAEYAERYVWDYDGVPIQLFNNEAIEGISVPKGNTVDFYAFLEEPGNSFSVETSGGTGDVQIVVEGLRYDLEFNDGGWDGPRPGFDIETVTSTVAVKSSDAGTTHTVTFSQPMNGRIDIQLTGVSDAEEITIRARWDRSDFPIEPVDPVEPSTAASCKELAKEQFAILDRDGNGLLDEEEARNIDAPLSQRQAMDVNDDNAVEFREFLQYVCSCDIELALVFDALSEGRASVSIEYLEAHTWSNDYDFPSMNTNEDQRIDRDELSLLLLMCTTTFDAFDSDGDGVQDEDDAFPDDPSETKDTDGDGVGDNADIVASVSNDIIYASAGVLAIVLFGVLLLFVRGQGSSRLDDGWQKQVEHILPSNTQEEDLLTQNDEITPSIDTDFSLRPSDLTSQPSLYSEQSLAPIAARPDAPHEALMGMMVDGIEVIEHPSGSDLWWKRTDPDAPWTQR